MFVKGVIMSSYGINGYVKVKNVSNGFEEFLGLKGNSLVLRKGFCSSIEVRVENVTLANGVPLLKFEGFDSPESVRNLVGFELWVGDELASQLEEGEYYFGKLIGYSVVNDGKELGVVVSFLECGNCALLEVNTGVRLFFIPFLDVYLGEIDMGLKTIELKVLELLE
ncbi:ribosome maturation factor RimM [Borrelia sp. BU AG58]|uniref:ribosome maturation factor RimM n=1 Tax=Borrelia sp. BU AG58 TaxID=2887345 RepID=UPI001E462636|nr:ribosome maturation factor RimM [Borrelia sp. BU AG58]UER67845.1 ribosome maturation factor RimM [Borrelia sp. BU AG58]